MMDLGSINNGIIALNKQKENHKINLNFVMII